MNLISIILQNDNINDVLSTLTQKTYAKVRCLELNRTSRRVT